MIRGLRPVRGHEGRAVELRDHFPFTTIRNNQAKPCLVVRKGDRQIAAPQDSGVDGCAFLNFKCAYDAVRFILKS
jgi:hypothetical protein